MRPRSIVGMFVVTLVLLFASFGAHPTGQTATPSAAFSLTKVAGIERSAIVAEFTGDGRLDVIASAGTVISPHLVMAAGAGDGSLGTPQPLGMAGEPLAVGDLNGDSRTDVVFRGDNDDIYVLPGNGNGTFAARRLVHAASGSRTSAVLGTFSATDTIPDVAVIGPDAGGHTAIAVYPGNGDFTFGTPVTQSAPDGISAARAADLNGDTVTDVIALAGCCTSISMLQNTGSMTFDVREFPMNADVGDIRAADLDGDGTTDVVVSQFLADAHPFSSPADVAVLWGGFEATQKDVYDTGVDGEYALALGDFTGDGRMDIATGNWSTSTDDHNGEQMWSSVSVLKGLPPGGTVRFGSPVTFALGHINRQGYTTSWSLDAGDLNGDGRLDLVHAPGAVLVNRVPAANRAPAAFAGPDQTFNREAVVTVMGEGTDPDTHWLEYQWNTGDTTPWFTIGNLAGTPPGVYNFTLTVDDGQGGTASDSVTLTVADTPVSVVELLTPAFDEPIVATGSPYTIRWGASDDNGPIQFFHVSYSTDAGRTFSAITECINLAGTARSCVWQNPGPAADRALLRIEALYGSSNSWVDLSNEFRLAGEGTPSLPSGWQNRDVGSVGAPGGASFSDGTFTVRGSGADIWGTADEFQYAFTTFSGDFDVVARVATVGNVNEWTKAGLMIRNDLRPGSAHVSLFATPSTTKGVSYQTRNHHGDTSLQRARVSAAPPVWLKLMRRGTAVAAAWRRSATDVWTELPFVGVVLDNTIHVGFAVSSHVDATLATATFDNFTLTSRAGLPAGWHHTDIGAVSAAGTATFAETYFNVEGSGADIWGTADEFHFAHTTMRGNFDITTIVPTVEHVHAWTKAGLMIRETLAPGSRHASLFATPSSQKGVAFQRRATTNGLSSHTTAALVEPPVNLRLVREGDEITAYFRTFRLDPWRFVGRQRLTALADAVHVGLAVSSHVDGTLATARFNDVQIVDLDSFALADIGSVGHPGVVSSGPDGITIEGSGADIWNNADAFTYYYRVWSGDGAITVRVNSLETTHVWAKAGVMFRESLNARSKHVMAIVSPRKGVAMQYRAGTGGFTENAAITTGAAPEWLRLVRAGNTFTGFASEDGTTWRTLGSVTVPMAGSILVGLPVTSHDNTTLATAVFSEPVIAR